MSTPSFPSFASFPDINSEESSSRNEPEHRRKDKGDKRKRKDDKHNRKGERDRKRHRPQTDDVLPEVVKPSTMLAGGEGETWRLFYSDRRGDMLNIQFGGLHVGHIPKYHLVDGGRSILGLSSAWTAHRSGKGIAVEVRGQRKFRELLDPGVRALLATEPKWRILASGDVYKHKEVDGYLPLPSHRAQENNQAYRSITQTKGGNESDSASDLERESESEESDSDGPTLTSHQESLKLLERQLSENPTSVKLWLSLLAQTLSTVPLLSKNATKAQAEITLPVLSRAISADPTNAKSKVLRIKYLKAGEEVWQESKLEDEWEDALKVGGAEIWMEWLEWRIRSKKGIDGVTEHAVRAMRAFGSDLEGELAKLRIFWRVAVAFQHAGYTERATALFQAQAEITFKSPHSLRKSTFDSLLESFEEFWESETPRVGEPTARGWDAWAASGNKQGTIPVSTHVPSAVSELDPYRQWAANELIADHALTLPARSTDKLAELDPYSTILFADIRPLLFDLRTSKGKNAFRLAWISFLGLHVPGFYKTLSHPGMDELDADWDDRWCFTHLCKTSHLKATFPEVHELRQPQADAIAGVLVGRENQYGCSFGPIRDWSSGVLGALQAVFFRITDGSKRKEKRCFMWEKEDLEDVDEQCVRNIFAQLNMEDDDAGWYNLSLAFEAALEVKSALKLSRHYLSTAQNSLSRWASHAQLERMRGRLDDARKVYHTVLIASPHLTGTAQLWWDWAEMEWLSNKRQEALGVVIRSAGVEGKGGVAILRARRILEESAKSNEKWKEREAWTKLRALLELLTTGDAKAAFDLFDSHQLEEGNSEHESLMVTSLLTVYYHSAILQNPMPPSLLRERAQQAIEMYPSNSIILGLFLEGEKGQGVWGRIRSSTGESGGRSKDVARRVEEVWLASWKKGCWTEEIERTRSGLSAAVEHERTRASPIIWRIYIEFELRANDLQRAKNLLYRAVAECPLVKELYLLAFGPLRSVFRKEELANFADTMAERGIRMRQGLDEILERWTMGKGVEEREGEENNEQLDEMEENARELRRLMPY